MTTAAVYLLTFAGTCVVLLFLGGIASALVENRREKRETGTVTRPGWKRQPKRYVRAGLTPAGRARDYRHRLIVWPLLLLGLAGLADRYMARQGAGRGGKHLAYTHDQEREALAVDAAVTDYVTGQHRAAS